jgi:ubiquitin carboxyl-terminal hydrolase 7
LLISLAHHRFNSKETDWGFAQFCAHTTLSKIIDGTEICALEDDSFTLRVFVKEIADPTGVLWHNYVEYVLLDDIINLMTTFVVGTVN